MALFPLMNPTTRDTAHLGEFRGEVWHAPSGDFDLHAYKQFQPSVLAAFPDGYWTIEDMIAEGDGVAWRCTFCGTHRGEFMGFPATGRHIRMSLMLISRIAEGKIAEEWEIWDGAGMAQQLGACPSNGRERPTES
jgi:predicted ester cyclase